MVFDKPGVNMAELWKKSTPYQLDREKLFANRDWFAENYDSLWEKYKGKVVAVYDQQVVAMGENADQVWEQIGNKYSKQAVMVILVPWEPIFRVPYPSDQVQK